LLRHKGEAQPPLTLFPNPVVPATCSHDGRAEVLQALILDSRKRPCHQEAAAASMAARSRTTHRWPASAVTRTHCPVLRRRMRFDPHLLFLIFDTWKELDRQLNQY
jgi:hypothetical protein